MTKKLPHISGKEAIRALEKAGFFIKRQSGSPHAIMRHQTNLSCRCIVPLHGSRTIKPGTLHSILKGTGLSIEEFINYLK